MWSPGASASMPMSPMSTQASASLSIWLRSGSAVTVVKLAPWRSRKMIWARALLVMLLWSRAKVLIWLGWTLLNKRTLFTGPSLAIPTPSAMRNPGSLRAKNVLTRIASTDPVASWAGSAEGTS